MVSDTGMTPSITSETLAADAGAHREAERAFVGLQQTRAHDGARRRRTPEALHEVQGDHHKERGGQRRRGVGELQQAVAVGAVDQCLRTEHESSSSNCGCTAC